MCTVVDDAVHVKVKAVKFRDMILGNQLRYGRISLTEPSEEFGNTHGGGGCRTKNGFSRSGKRVMTKVGCSENYMRLPMQIIDHRRFQDNASDILRILSIFVVDGMTAVW